MNFAFSALLIFILLLPGIILYYTYARGFWTWNSPVSIQSYTDQIVPTVVGAIILHTLSIYCLSLIGFSVDLESVFRLLLNSYGKDDIYLDQTIKSITDYPGLVVSYFFLLCFIGAVFGYGAHFAVRKLKLDLKTKLFRFRNEWYYLLSGEILEFNEFTEPLKPGENPLSIETVFVYLSAIVEQGNDTYLYRGIVADFFYDENGQLGRVLLRDAHRRLLSEDRDAEDTRSDRDINYRTDTRYYFIEGNYFLLNYTDMKTLNVEYITTVPEVDENIKHK